MGLFMSALEQEAKSLSERNVRLEFVGDRSAFSADLRERIEESEALTAYNTGLKLSVAANYGGQWDILQATRTLAREVSAGRLDVDDIDADRFSRHLCFNDVPEPDLFIRTGGETRISNFLLWQLAYTELYFTDTLWPDFDRNEFELALDSFSGRQRRFGQTGQQVEQAAGD